MFFYFDPQVIEVKLSTIVPHVSGPKRPQDRVEVSNMKKDFASCLNEKVCFVLSLFYEVYAGFIIFSLYPVRLT